MLALALLLRIIAPPVDASNVAAAERSGWNEFTDARGVTHACGKLAIQYQHPMCRERLRWALLTISNRESAGNWSPERRYTGVHKGDSQHAPKIWRRVTRVGRLSSWCPSHRTPGGMSTVGPHGLMYGYHVQRLGVPGNCLPTWAFGLGPVSARVAVALYVAKCCDGDQGFGWCPSVESIAKTKHRARRRHYKRA